MQMQARELQCLEKKMSKGQQFQGKCQKLDAASVLKDTVVIFG
jgi:hypothetical protein